MFLSVIVPTSNRYPLLRKCLASLRPEAQGLGGRDYEVIVTDDAPNGSLRDQLAADFPWVRWVQGPRRGPAANRNCGAKIATGEWLVFIDDDCIAKPNLLPAYLDAIAGHPACHVFEGRTSAEPREPRMDEEAPINETGGFLWSCNFAIRRDVFVKMDGFCELFPYAALEDVDLRERLKKAGEPFLFVPHAGVVHPWRSMGWSLRSFKVQVVSHEILYARHPELRPRPGFHFSLIARRSAFGLFIDAPRKRFRGFGRWMLRHLLTTLVNFVMAARSIRNRKCRGISRKINNVSGHP